MSPKLQAPFPYFGGKSKAAEQVWAALGDVSNYVEPFCGSAAMLLAAPPGARIETVNDKDSFIANFWRAVRDAPLEVAHHADWPVIETDLFARHSWLVGQRADLTDRLNADPQAYDAKIAGWWAWGACAWIGSGWCSGSGPWVHDGNQIVDRRKMPHMGDAGKGINRQMPDVGNTGKGVNRQMPHVGNTGNGINRKMPHVGNAGRGAWISAWMQNLSERLRDVRVLSGDWARVVQPSVTLTHGCTGVFLDPPYTKGDLEYAVGGCGGALAGEVRDWCAANGGDANLRIVLCGHAGEHDELLAHGWHVRRWKAGQGYAKSDEAKANYESETLWCSPACIPEVIAQPGLIFEFA